MEFRCLHLASSREEEDTVLSLDECVGMSGLSEAELEIVAQRECVPVMVATGLANGLLQSARGLHRLHMMFRDAIAAAAERRDETTERQVSGLYRGFRMRYPVPPLI